MSSQTPFLARLCGCVFVVALVLSSPAGATAESDNAHTDAAQSQKISSPGSQDHDAAARPLSSSLVTHGTLRPTVGWIEKVALTKGSIVLNAKLDTGADYSSLHAHDIQEFERDGDIWVKFEVADRVGRNFSVERKVIRKTSIKRPGGKHERRNVIRLGICLGNTYLRSDVNLVDRSDFKLQMLLGRNFLAGSVAIDPAISFTTEPNCETRWTSEDSQS